MQNKRYTIEFLSPPEDWLRSMALSSDCELVDFADSCLPANPHVYTEHDTYGMEYFHWPAWLSVWLCSLPAPAQLLVSQIRETEKSPGFLSNN